MRRQLDLNVASIAATKQQPRNGFILQRKSVKVIVLPMNVSMKPIVAAKCYKNAEKSTRKLEKKNITCGYEATSVNIVSSGSII